MRPRLQGMAFSLYERQYLGLHGLLPPAFMTEEQQAYRVMKKLREQPDDLARYIQLDNLQVAGQPRQSSRTEQRSSSTASSATTSRN